MNALALKTAVKRFGFDDTDPLLTWVNAAYSDWCEAFEWPWLKRRSGGSFLAGNSGFSSLPVDLGTVISFTYLSGTTEITIPFNNVIETADFGGDFAETGPPQYWGNIEDSFFVYPIPDKVYTWLIYYIASPVDLAADSDIPKVPSRYHYHLVQKAAAYGLEADNQEERAQIYRSYFDNAVEKAKSRVKDGQVGKFGSIRDTVGR